MELWFCVPTFGSKSTFFIFGTRKKIGNGLKIEVFFFYFIFIFSVYYGNYFFYIRAKNMKNLQLRGFIREEIKKIIREGSVSKYSGSAIRNKELDNDWEYDGRTGWYTFGTQKDGGGVAYYYPNGWIATVVLGSKYDELDFSDIKKKSDNDNKTLLEAMKRVEKRYNEFYDSMNPEN